MLSRKLNLSRIHGLTLQLALISIFITLAAIFLFGCNQSTAAPDTGLVREVEYIGHVIDANTLQPIANAKITLTLEGVPPVVYTDSEGIYRFKVLIQSNMDGQIRVDAQGYQVYTRNISISPALKNIEDIRLSPMATATPNSVPTSTLTPTPVYSATITVMNNFYSWINNASTKDDFIKSWNLETSGPNGLQCREASACTYSKFQDSWWLWKVQYKLYDCGSNLVDVELSYYRREALIAITPMSPIYVRYQLIEVGDELKINKGQSIGSPGVDCMLKISVP